MPTPAPTSAGLFAALATHSGWRGGGRARLVDEDRMPLGPRAALADVTPARAETHFEPCYQGCRPWPIWCKP